MAEDRFRAAAVAASEAEGALRWREWFRRTEATRAGGTAFARAAKKANRVRLRVVVLP